MKDEIWEIIGKSASGNLNADEKQLLDNWLKINQNTTAFDQVKKILDLSGNIEYKMEVNVDKEWENFNNLKNADKTKNKIINFLPYKALSIAAMIILGIFISIFIFIKQPADDKLIVVETIKNKQILSLPDGSKIWLNKNSKAIYNQEFKEKRHLDLTGEAFFEIKTDSLHPFVIDAEGSEITVYGTSFNVRAYQNEKTIEVSVTQGKVTFSGNAPDKKIILEKGSMGILRKETNELNKESNLDPNVIAWQNNKLSFNNQTLEYIQKVAGNYFEIPFEIPENMKNCSYTGTFDKPNLDEFLIVLTLALNSDYKILKDRVIVSGEGCK